MTLQEKPTLIQGNHHSFHADAAVRMGIERTACLPMDTHSDLYEALRSGKASDAVVAIVNSSIGRIVGSYEELMIGNQTVIDRVDLPIRFGLYGLPEATSDDIRVVHTQSHAYRQCTAMLAQHLPGSRWQEEQDTAGSAVIVAKLANKTHAAICSKQAGKAAGLSCIYETLQDDMYNCTTFYRIVNRGTVRMPMDVDVIVAVLHTKDYDLARKRLHSADIPAEPLHVLEMANESLIIEIRTTNHEETLLQAEQALEDIGTIRYLGGYRD